MPRHVVLAGGVGAARFLRGLVGVVDPASVSVIVNTGDDVDLHGLRVSPDIDTVIYTLAGAVDDDRGWGLLGETWQAMGTLSRLGDAAWFNLGDRDLGTHMFRTGRLGDGASLTDVTASIAHGWGLGVEVLPMSDERVETRVTVDEGEIGFQEYFVQRRHSVPVRSVRFAGVESARPGPEVVARIESADTVVVAPSNPLVSIAPILAVPGIADAVRARRDAVVAVSPIVGGAALKGPADRMMGELGHEVSAVGVARLYADLAAHMVIDTVDAAMADEVAASGIRPVVTDTVMSSADVAESLAREVLACVHEP